MVARFSQPIPAILQPVGDKCVPIFIPDDPDYVTAFVEVVRSLTFDRTWERSDDNAALIVRQEWMNRTFAPLLDALTSGNDCGSGVLESDGNCYTYPAYAPFINYSPQNPFNDPDLVPDGYLTTPFTRFADFPLIGWLSTWLPSFTEELTGYLPNDIIVDISSLPLNANFQDLLGGTFPQIAINVEGNGIAELHMINWPLGGRAIVTIDAQPNIGDIFGGIFGEQEFSIELNRDILSLPPETVSSAIYEVIIDEPTITSHTIFITFLPTIDDSFIPINFGGGLRDVKLCGFDDLGVIMGITDVRINNCEIEIFDNGAWSPITGSLQACISAQVSPVSAIANQNTIDIASNLSLIGDNQAAITTNANNISQNVTDIDALELDATQKALTINDHETRIVALENASPVVGGNSAAKVTVYTLDIVGADISIPVGGITVMSVNHTFTLPNALIHHEVKAKGGTSGTAIFKQLVSGIVGTHLAKVFSTTQTSTEINNVFQIAAGTHSVDLFADKSGSATIEGEQIVQLVVTEFGDPDAGLINPIVTFDGNTAPYTLSDQPQFEGTVGSGGNPDNCLSRQSMIENYGLQVFIDLGEPKQIDNILLDIFCSDLASLSVFLFVDGQLQGGFTPSGTNNQWLQFGYPAGIFPVTGQIVLIQPFNSQPATLGELRIDNITIDTGGA